MKDELGPEAFIGLPEFAALLGWTEEQVTAARRAGRFIPPHAQLRGEPLWWRRDVDDLLTRLDQMVAALKQAQLL